MKTKPIPIALPHDLLEQVDQVQHLTGMSKADIMRLCMRIGLVDLRAAEHDLPGIVKRIADDAGLSFQQWSKEKSEQNEAGQKNANLLESQECAPPAPSRKRSPSTGPTPTTANIVRLPPPPVIATLLHDMVAETSNPSPVTEPRSEARYEKKRRKA